MPRPESGSTPEQMGLTSEGQEIGQQAVENHEGGREQAVEEDKAVQREFAAAIQASIRGEGRIDHDGFRAKIDAALEKLKQYDTDRN